MRRINTVIEAEFKKLLTVTAREGCLNYKIICKIAGEMLGMDLDSPPF